MATSRGGAEVRQFIRGLPLQLERKVLRGAGRAGANVIAADARERCISSEVQGAIKVRVATTQTTVTGRITADMGGWNLPLWLEYGTAPHFISVDNSQRGGISVKRINKDGAGGSLVINGQFVGDTVHHPGARPHPFLRPALDNKTSEAIAAAQGYINSRVSRDGITGADDSEASDQ